MPSTGSSSSPEYSDTVTARATPPAAPSSSHAAPAAPPILAASPNGNNETRPSPSVTAPSSPADFPIADAAEPEAAAQNSSESSLIRVTEEQEGKASSPCEIDGLPASGPEEAHQFPCLLEVDQWWLEI
ncbi:unnamed protein product [Linum tenue]|uniref:Uncharacterized protein n=1 Tax=Linum tenue TaxID=586396 RepID=A0AAV0MC58_9ROSI|nr:unnamed protein product [Linum tenue]